jgi:hypothetical protein
MISRGTVIAALIVVELAVLGEIGVALRGGAPVPWSVQRTEASSGPRLVEGGAHKTFEAGNHPALTVDIGYADLTIVTRDAPQIDVSVSKSRDFGFLRSREPITARQDGDAIRIVAPDAGGWSSGDDRMVTVVVPAQTQVTVVNAGDIKATGLRAEASLNSTGSGYVAVDDFNAPALHVTANGRITLNQVVSARLNATSSDGHVEGSGLQVRDGSVESDGRVTLGFATGSDSLVTAETNDGRISVSGFTPVASVETGRKSGDDDDSASQTVRIGAGAGHLDVHSSDGSIHLIQES